MYGRKKSKNSLSPIHIIKSRSTQDLSSVQDCERSREEICKKHSLSPNLQSRKFFKKPEHKVETGEMPQPMAESQNHSKPLSAGDVMSSDHQGTNFDWQDKLHSKDQVGET